MSDVKHTPGPWEFVPAGNRPVVQQEGRFPHGFICNVESLNFVADARLIAAAPEMLNALMAQVYATTPSEQLAADRLTELAIAKATKQ